MLPTSLAGMAWLRGQIRAVAASVVDACILSQLPSSGSGSSNGGVDANSSGTASGSASSVGACTRSSSSSSSSSMTSGGGGGGSARGGSAGAFRPDVIVANQLAYGQVHCAEALGAPLQMIYTIPWLATAQLPHPWARGWGASLPEAAARAAGAAARAALAVRDALVAPRRRLLSALGVGVASGTSGASDARAAGCSGRDAADAIEAAVAAAANRLSGPLLDFTAWCGVADILLGVRRRLGLPILSAPRAALGLAAQYGAPASCLWSEALLARPADWSPQVAVSAFALLDGGDNDDDDGRSNAGAASYAPPRRLLDFLSAGPEPPIFVGLGSCVLGGPRAAARLLALVREAAAAAGVRVVFATGWAGAGGGGEDGDGDGERSSGSEGAAAVDGAGCGSEHEERQQEQSSHHHQQQRVCVIDEAPHSYLFPRCLALVHHGGVGTVAAGLRAARPMAALPAFGDLFLWADRCHRALRVGPAPVPLERLDAEALAALLRDLAGGARPGGAYAAAAAAVAARLEGEDGAGAAAAAVVATAMQGAAAFERSGGREI